MNNRAPFQVIAIIPDDDDASTEKVKQAVARRFDLDLKHYSREFQEEGVCIQHALTLEDALKTTLVVQELGASCRVLDAGGQVVTESEPTADADDGDEAALELDDRAHDFSGVEVPQGTARDLGADDLVMLDGAIGDLGEAEFPELGEPAVQEGATAKPDVTPGAFAGTPLELDDPGPQEAGAAFEADDMEFQLPDPDAAPASDDATPDGGLFQELDDSLGGKPSKLALARGEELKQATRKVSPMDDMGSRSRRPSQAVSHRGPRRASSSSTAMASSGGGVVMFGGFFRQRPRLRIVVGFLLALGLGGVVPAVHASTAYKEQVKPLLVDLATSRANESRQNRAPGVPSVREMEEKINKHRMESFSYTLAIWLGCFAALSVLWFKFC